MPTTMERLQKIIDTKKALQISINNKGGAITDDTPFNEYPLAVDGLSTGGGGQDWAPNTHWWDIKKIVEEDETESVNKLILLIDNDNPTISFNLRSYDGTRYGDIQLVKAKTSDGVEYTTSNFTHTWDTSKDKPCYIDGVELYKTRWIMLCFNSTGFSTYGLDYSEDSYSTYWLKNTIWFWGVFSQPCTMYLYSKPNLSINGGLEAISKIPNLQILTQSEYNSTSIFNNASSLRNFEGIKDTVFKGNCEYLFFGCYAPYKIDVNFNNPTSFYYAFYKCTNLRELNITGDTSNVGSWRNAFNGCSKLKTIKGTLSFDNATTIYDTFNECKMLEELPVINAHKTSYLYNAFKDCENLKKITINRDGTTACNAKYAFARCKLLEDFLGDFSFNQLDVENMFEDCYKLKSLPLIDISYSSSAYKMLYGCSELTTVTINCDGSKTSRLNQMMSGCRKLEEINGAFSLAKATDVGNIVYNCINLKRVSFTDIKVALQVGSGTSWGHLLELDSLIKLCKECIKTSSSLKLTVGSANLEKLASVYVKFTDATQTEIATGEKGEVEVCESTDAGAMTISDYMILKNWTLA